MTEVYGVDPSLTGTGIACPEHETVIDTVGLRGPARLFHLQEAILEHVARGAGESDRLVVLEGYAFARTNQAHQLGELGGVIRLALWRRRIPYVEVAPQKLKIFATGSGKATKEEVLGAAIRRLGYGGDSPDEADAMWLRAMGCALVGSPLVDLPVSHTRALDGLAVPAGVEVA